MPSPLPIGPTNTAFGFWRFTSGDYDICVELIETAREAGVVHFDTADIYGLDEHFGAVEELLGKIHRRVPSVLEGATLATKVGIQIGSPYNSSSGYLVEATEASLKRLGRESVDLLYIHRPDLMTHPAEVAEGLDQLIRQGKTMRVGVSNYTPEQVAALSRHLNTVVTAHQFEFSALEQDALFDGRLDQLMQEDIQAIAWSPLAGGRILAHPAEERGRRVQAALQTIADEMACSLSVAALAFIHSHPAPITPILGTRTKGRLIESLAASEIKLTRAQWYRVVEAWRGAKMP